MRRRAAGISLPPVAQADGTQGSQQLTRCLDTGGVRLSDGTLIGVANYPGCQQRSEFAGFARYGFAKSSHRYVWGVQLVSLTDERGLPLGYTIVPANEKEYEPLADQARLAAAGTTLLTPDNDADIDGRTMVELLNGIPGALEHAQLGRKRARAGENLARRSLGQLVKLAHPEGGSGSQEVRKVPDKQVLPDA